MVVATAIPAAVAAAITAAVTGPAIIVTAAQVLARGLALDHLDGDERQLSAVVDLADLDLDLLADLDDVVDVVDPHAAMQLADLGDVQQAVPAGQQRDERAERGRLHDGAEEPLANLGDVRVGDRVDRRPGRLGRGAVGGPDVEGAVGLDRDLGPSLVLDRVDHLALRADDLADLVHRDLDRDD